MKISNSTSKISFKALSDIGKKYKHLEDAYVLPLPNEKYGIQNPDTEQFGHLFILADGVGGAQAGEVAAELTGNWIFKAYYQPDGEEISLPAHIPQIIQDVNGRIVQLADEHPEYKGMATTLLVLLLLDETAYFYSVGDSRIYGYKQGKLRQITEDQSEVWPLYKSGAISKEEIRSHPRRNIVTQVIGVPGEVIINQYSEKIHRDSMYLMCSDGLTDMVPEEEIVAILESDTTLEIRVRQLVARANYLGGRDNITVILVKIDNTVRLKVSQKFRSVIRTLLHKKEITE